MLLHTPTIHHVWLNFAVFKCVSQDEKGEKGEHSQSTSGKASMKSVLDNLGELWDQQQYDTEYNLDSFMHSLQWQGLTSHNLCILAKQDLVRAGGDLLLRLPGSPWSLSPTTWYDHKKESLMVNSYIIRPKAITKNTATIRSKCVFYYFWIKRSDVPHGFFFCFWTLLDIPLFHPGF